MANETTILIRQASDNVTSTGPQITYQNLLIQPVNAVGTTLDACNSADIASPFVQVMKIVSSLAAPQERQSDRISVAIASAADPLHVRPCFGSQSRSYIIRWSGVIPKSERNSRGMPRMYLLRPG
jgi:hypothetical protein